ncbi:MAG: TonB-dependent receptor [Bacteroidetes bacterium]|nr:TonB-dependent receptor [Bacteroidota bacterium]
MTLLLTSISTLSAQNAGRISGNVTDIGNEPLPGVQIVIEGTTRGTITEIDGFYDFINVPSGTYALVFRYLGYATVRVENVEVIVGRTTQIDIQMEEELIAGEEIVVLAERPLVQRDRTTTTAFVTQEQIQALPVQSINDVINLQAGVVEGHFRGGRTNEVMYMVNGVPINNPYSNTPGFVVESNMVSDLEVITGVFNAEFGQATSGVVNISTRTPPRAWSFDILTFASAVGSTRSIEFLRRDAEPGSNLSFSDFSRERVPHYRAASFPNRTELNINAGGPLISDKLGLMVNARYVNDLGRFVGRELFMPSDYSGNAATFTSSLINNPGNPDNWEIESTGSGKFVMMTPNRRFSANTTLVYFPTSMLRLEYNFFLQSAKLRNFDHFSKYAPEGRNWTYPENYTHIANMRYTFNASTFANLSYSYQIDRAEWRLFGNPIDDQIFDSRILPGEFRNQTGPYTFLMGGNDIGYSRNYSNIHNVVGSITSQVNRFNQIKTGFQLSFQKIDRAVIGIDVTNQNNFQPVRTTQEWRNNYLNITPVEFATYIQNKIELSYLIINAGLRFDYFDPDFDVPVSWAQASELTIPDPDDPSRDISNRVRAKPKYQLSPRLGVAFPLSDMSVIRFSYGMFFQVPNYADLYSNPDYIANPLSETTRYGNPDVRPQSTTTFEVGYQQGLTQNLGLELTLYMRDVRNLIADQIERDVNTTNFAVRYVNREFGSVRGITLSLFQKPVGPISWTLDYTLQFADGSYAITGDLFERVQSGLDETLTLARLDWDRRHVLNNSVIYKPNNKIQATVINVFTSGRPYTTSRNNIQSFIRNNEDRPPGFNTNVRVYYTPRPGVTDLSLFFQVDNLFDIKTANIVYADTGQPDNTFELQAARRLNVTGLNSVEDYFNRQDFYNAPRIINFGIQLKL